MAISQQGDEEAKASSSSSLPLAEIERGGDHGGDEKAPKKVTIQLPPPATRNDNNDDDSIADQRNRKRNILILSLGIFLCLVAIGLSVGLTVGKKGSSSDDAENTLCIAIDAYRVGSMEQANSIGTVFYHKPRTRFNSDSGTIEILKFKREHLEDMTANEVEYANLQEGPEQVIIELDKACNESSV